jgi:hypothetical protein
MTFRVGQKVVCVDDRHSGEWSAQWVKIGSVYTVAAVGVEPHLPTAHLRGIEYITIRLVGVMKPGSFASVRFRPIVERRTDISFAHEILRKATKPARTPLVTSNHRGIENG